MSLPVGTIMIGDARTQLTRLPDESVDCIITSPPYFRLRNYGQPEQIGLETHVDEWVNELRLVARGLHRVLRPSGGFWLNLGDTFARHARDGAPPKSLVLAPERLAIGLVADGWILRNKVVWAKTNPMPTSVKDRLSCTWEVVYFFTKSDRYHFDLDAIRIPHRSTRQPSHRSKRRRSWAVPPEWRGPAAGSNGGLDRLRSIGLAGHPLGKNPGDVWPMATAAYRGAHHAVFPIELAERPILASCPPGEIVLDPFMGSGTTAIAAEKHDRQWIGIELNPDFAAQAMERITSARRRPDEPASSSAAEAA